MEGKRDARGDNSGFRWPVENGQRHCGPVRQSDMSKLFHKVHQFSGDDDPGDELDLGEMKSAVPELGTG